MKENMVIIENIEQFSRDISELDATWDDITTTSLQSVLMRNPRTLMMRRVPKSDPKRYAKKDGSKSAANKRMERGNLQRSFHVTPMRYDSSVSIGFGERSVIPYANYQHELPDPLPSGKPVQYSTPNTGNKFVQVPLEETADETPERVCKEIDARLRRMGL